MIVEEVFSNEGWETFIMGVASEADDLYGCSAIPADQPKEGRLGFVVYKMFNGKEVVSYPRKKLSEFSCNTDIFDSKFKDEILSVIKTGADEVHAKIAQLEKEA